MRKFLFSWSVVFVILDFAGESLASVLYVDVNSTNSVAPFASWGTAATNIQDAVDASVAGDTVSVTNGHYLLSSEIKVNKNITIQSVNSPAVTIVDAGRTSRCFNLGGSCLISGFTITNGYVATGNGGGVYCGNTFPVIENCIISGNTAGGGGIYHGGGVYSGTLNNCLIKNNSAHTGAGLGNSVANNCVITDNLATKIVGEGGGIDSGTANNCLITGNYAGWKGGGTSRTTASNCIIVGNSADLGGGMYSGTARNCIVWYNRNILYGVDASYTCSPSVEHGVDGNITNAPLLVSASHIATNSPCRGAGSAAYATGTDIDGEAWLDLPSMGCDEIPGVVTGAVYMGIIGPLDLRAGFEARYAIDVVGAVTGTLWDFGDGTVITNAILPSLHTWDLPGNYDMVLTAFNDEYPSGISITQHVAVLSAEETAIYVSDVYGDDANDGLEWATAKKSIQAGVDVQAIRGGIVLVSNGTYVVDSEILITKDITIQSVNGPDATIVDGGGVTRCFNLTESDCLVSGFTITNGNSADYGGGIDCGDASPAVVENCIITGNSAAYYGGGMSDGTANNCIISRNLSGRGGGGMSGGIANNCTISGNTTSDYGGGMDRGMTGGTANNCVISGNSANSGGGMSGVIANNCAILRNSATNHGGGMDDCTANNCTIVENTAGYGCGMYRGTANNSVVWYNAKATGSEDNLSNTIANHTSSPEVTHGVDGNTTNAPLLVSAFHVASGSPCWGAGSSLYSNGLDIDGETWLNPPSMGCDEYHGVGSVTGAVEVAIDGTSRVVEDYSADFSARIDGPITMHVWNFGDGTLTTNNLYPSHAWGISGNYAVLLTAFSDTYPEGVSATQVVQVVSLSGSVIHVSVQTGNDANDGLGWATAKATIQASVDTQDILGGMVLVSNGTYAVASQIMVDKNISIQSVNGSDETVVDGGGSNRCFYIESNSCRISGFTVTNGYIFDGAPSSANGGGIYCSTRSPIVENCIITGNTAMSYAGGIYRGTVTNCTITGNSASRYGGGMCYGTANNCTFGGNVATNRGGGIYGCTAANCIITGNSAWDGGGVYSGTANNCTISGNTASGFGGGMNRGTANNCIIWYNSAGYGNNIADTIVSHSCSPDVNYGSDGNFTNAPLFVDFAGSDYLLLPNSPCINWGNNTYVSDAVDLDGNPRVIEGYVDMGCYEYQGLIGEADNDVDGMSDAWERQWFGVNVSPDGNADGDVSSNGDEYVAGTDPTNSASYFMVTNDAAEVEGETRFIIEWTAVTGRVYNILWTPSLTQEFQPLEIGITYPQNSYIDTVHFAESSGFYRVVVMRADYDADGDGLPNDWETQYAVADAYADGDDDGFNNLAEFISGTDPTNGASYFAAANSAADVGGTNCFVVEWISIPDRLYSVQWSTNLVSGFQTLETGLEHPQNSYTDTTHNAESAGFYQVEVRMK